MATSEDRSNRIFAWLADMYERPNICRHRLCERRVPTVTQVYRTLEYCDRHSCHVCHEKRAVVRFGNDQIFCTDCNPNIGQIYPLSWGHW